MGRPVEHRRSPRQARAKVSAAVAHPMEEDLWCRCQGSWSATTRRRGTRLGKSTTIPFGYVSSPAACLPDG